MPARQQIFQDEPEKQVVNDLGGGVNYGAQPSKIPENQFTDALNMQNFIGLVQVDKGYGPFRQAVLGTPQLMFSIESQGGIITNYLLTTQTLYRDSGVEWQWVSDGIENNSLTAQTNGGSNIFNVNAIDSLQVGNSVGIILSDGTQLRTSVQALNGLQVTTVAAVPAGKNALAGAAFVRPPAFNGILQFQPDFTPWPILGAVILTNGVDPIQIFDGVQCTPLPGWAGITCRQVASFHQFLIAFDTTEHGTRFPTRKRWSDSGNPEVTNAGLAGFVDLADTSDIILAVLPLGPYLIMYRQSSIMRSSFLGDPLLLFYDEYMIGGPESAGNASAGVWSSGSVVSVGSQHVLAGPFGIFRYSAGYDLEDIGASIFDRLYGPQGIANRATQFLTFLTYIEELDEVWLFTPTGMNSVGCDSLFRFEQGSEGWWPRKFANFVIAAGLFGAGLPRTWQQSLLPWNQDTGSWLTAQTQAASNQIVLFDPIANQGLLYDFSSSTDNGAPIAWSLTTRDYDLQSMEIRIDGVYARGRGNNVLVEISFDKGNTFTPYGTLNFGLTFTKQQVNNQLVGDVFRLRFSGSDPLSAIDWFRVDWFPESEW